ncbi:hypothetical protein WJ969_11770 [Achromobacter xylosoxidans]
MLRRDRHRLLRRGAGAAAGMAGAAAPLVRALVGIAMAALYLAWPISQSNILGASAIAVGTALLLLGGPAASPRRPARPGAC